VPRARLQQAEKGVSDAHVSDHTRRVYTWCVLELRLGGEARRSGRLFATCTTTAGPEPPLSTRGGTGRRRRRRPRRPSRGPWPGTKSGTGSATPTTGMRNHVPKSCISAGPPGSSTPVVVPTTTPPRSSAGSASARASTASSPRTPLSAGSAPPTPACRSSSRRSTRSSTPKGGRWRGYRRPRRGAQPGWRWTSSVDEQRRWWRTRTPSTSRWTIAQSTGSAMSRRPGSSPPPHPPGRARWPGHRAPPRRRAAGGGAAAAGARRGAVPGTPPR